MFPWMISVLVPAWRWSLSLTHFLSSSDVVPRHSSFLPTMQSTTKLDGLINLVPFTISLLSCGLTILFFSIFHILGIATPNFMPDFSDPEYGEWGRWEWYGLHLFFVWNLTVPMSYKSKFKLLNQVCIVNVRILDHRKQVNVMHAKNNINISKVTHAGKPYIAKTSHEHGASVNGVKALGGWNDSGIYCPCYDWVLPIDALLGVAMFNGNRQDSYFVPHAHLGKCWHFFFSHTTHSSHHCRSSSCTLGPGVSMGWSRTGSLCCSPTGLPICTRCCALKLPGGPCLVPYCPAPRHSNSIHNVPECELTCLPWLCHNISCSNQGNWRSLPHLQEPSWKSSNQSSGSCHYCPAREQEGQWWEQGMPWCIAG